MNDTEASTHSLIGITEGASIADAARLMQRSGIGLVGVYAQDARHLIGVLSERDVTLVASRNLDPASTRVTEAMTIHPVIVEGPVARSQALKLMQARHIRHLIVRERGGDHVLSMRDLVDHE